MITLVTGMGMGNVGAVHRGGGKKNVWKSDKSWEPEKIWKIENLKI